MHEKVRTVRVYGGAGAKFGREFRLAVASAAEAVQALSAQIPGFRHYLATSKARGIGFAVFYGRRNLSQDQLHDPPGAEDIRIAPVLIGAKRAGIFQIVVGVVLLAVSYFVPVLAPMLAPMGWSMIIGGVVQMLTPQPKGLSSKDSPENQASYMFNGIVNTQAGGVSVPVAYGDPWAGGAIVSAGIYAEDQL